jgi:hypothetical protein
MKSTSKIIESDDSGLIELCLPLHGLSLILLFLSPHALWSASASRFIILSLPACSIIVEPPIFSFQYWLSAFRRLFRQSGRHSQLSTSLLSRRRESVFRVLQRLDGLLVRQERGLEPVLAARLPVLRISSDV